MRGRAWCFAAAEYRDQDAVVQTGERDTAARVIRQGLAPAPLDDFLGLARLDFRASDQDTLGLRYLVQDEEDVAQSRLDRSIGSASQRQSGENRHHQGIATWTRVLGASAVNTLRVSYSDFRNSIDLVTPGRQLTFPTIQDGASFRVPQATTQERWQVTDSVSWVKGAHTLRVGGELSHTYGRFDPGVFREGRVELVQDFAEFDLIRDGRVDDSDLLFAVTLRSGKPDQDLLLDDCSSSYLAGFVQDDWRVTPQLTLNIGLRYELDTNVNYGWKCLLVMDPGLTAALATGLGAYAQATFPGLSPRAVALGAILAIAALNLLGVRLAAAIGHGLALAKIALLLGLVAWGFASGVGELGRVTPLLARPADSPPPVPALAGALVMAFFSFGGWWEAAKLAGEVREPRRVLPRALAIGVGAVTLLHLAVSAMFLYLVPIGAAGSDETFAAQAGMALFGPGGGRALSALVVVFVAGSLFAFMTFAPRLYFAMARDGAAPRVAGRIHARTGAPVVAIVLQAALAALLVVVGTFETIVAYFVFVTVAFLALSVAGLYRLPRPQPGAYRVPGWPVTPLVFLVMLLLMLALLGAGSPRQALLGSAVVAAGVVVYRLFVAPGRGPAPAAPLEEA